MPTIDFFKGIKINVYNGEHRPPHIHAVYNESEALVKIENSEIYSGHLPNKQLKMTFEWLAENANWALRVFYELNPGLK